LSAELTRARRRQLMLAAGVAVVLAIVLPFALAGGLGRFVGGLWVTVMGAVMSLVAAMFGG
jgi:lauroyl/myristoyl acyltransferase